MRNIKTIQGLINYVKENSAWQAATVRNVIETLGVDVRGSQESLKELSGKIRRLRRYGANTGFPGFIYYTDTVRFSAVTAGTL